MDELVGIWGCERILGPEIRGSLTVWNEGSQWRARAMGFEATAEVKGDRISFAIEGGKGAYHGSWGSDQSKIVGHWIQPRGLANRDSYATPTELTADKGASGIWRGEIVPLDDRITTYLVMSKQLDGTMTAFVRDPETNAGLWLRIEEVSLEDSNLRVKSSRYGDIVGTYDKEAGKISIALPVYPVTLDFTKQGRDDAVGFYTRTPHEDRYVYRQPLAENDGWQTGSLVDVGLDPKPIAALVERILQAETTDVRAPYIQGLLIARHGLLVLDEYFYGFDKETPHDPRSATKSLTTALVGVALDKGAQFDITTHALSLFPEYPEYTNHDPRKRRITIEHLLTMTSGLACDDNDDDSPGNEDVMQGQSAQPDWYKYTLDLPMAGEPGEAAVYCSAGINLLGKVISNTTHSWLPEFFHEHFAMPLDFQRYHVQLMPSVGDKPDPMYMGGGSYMRPRDLMKLGQVFLADGRWRDRQIISNEWVMRSLQPHSHFEDHDYGYGWHLGEYRVNARSYRRVEAGGNGGQFVIIIPELDMVVMFTAANYGNYPTWSKFRDELVPDYIIPAAH